MRTDFSDEAAWKRVCAAISEPAVDEPVDGFEANVEFVSDPEFEGLKPELLPELMPDDSQTFAFIVDHITIDEPEHPVLVVDLYNEPGRTFRTISSKMWAVENNLSIGNMGFEEFAEAVGRDGVFRGFPE